MKYGFFDDEKCEYVVNTPHTPLPWINYLGTDSFFSLISQTGGGYSFYKDAKLRRITRYRYNNVPRDTGGRMYYILDGEDVWSPAYSPAKAELDTFLCRHGLGYTIFETEKDCLATDLTCFVPLHNSCEINMMTLENKSNSMKELQIFSAVEWCLWNALDDSQNFQRNLSIGEVEAEGSTLYHKTEFRERRNHYSFFNVNREIDGFDTSRDAFLGSEGDWDCPDAVKNRKSSNSIAHGWTPMASHNIRLTLQPGETTSLIFMLGYVEVADDEKWSAENIINKEPAKMIINQFCTPGDVEKSFRELGVYWKKLLSAFQLESKEIELNRMVNIWNQYQNMITYHLSRSASYYESGIGRGMGFRDSCQDLLGFVHMAPEKARCRILDIAATQMEDGSAWHQYQPLTKRGNADIGSGFNDDPLWLIAAVDAYIRETGDGDILKEPVCFNNVLGSERELIEHLKRSVHFITSHLGPHGLPLIGRADWNDCLNLNCFSTDPAESFQTCVNRDTGIAESIMIAAMFVIYAEKYTTLCDIYDGELESVSGEETKEVKGAIQMMKCSIEVFGWDGRWFLRAYDSNGEKVGSDDCHEGKIYIEPQSFCVMAGIGVEDGKAKRALKSVNEYLTTPYGTCLLWPCYKTYHPELGEISSYPSGYKENGGIFCHSNPWLCIANTVIGEQNEAFEIYRRISPAYTEHLSELRKTEPYVYCQMLAGQEAPIPGEGKNSWLTGTAAWNFVAVSQYILGIRPEYDGLHIQPCLPEHIHRVKVTRLFRGIRYNIVLRRGTEKGLWINGRKLDNNTIPVAEKETNVEYVFE